MITSQIIALVATIVSSVFAGFSIARTLASVKNLKSSQKQDDIMVTNKDTGKTTIVSRHYQVRQEVSRKLLELAE